MSSLGNNPLPRDPSGRFIRKTDAPPLQPSVQPDPPPPVARSPSPDPLTAPNTFAHPPTPTRDGDATPLSAPHFSDLASKGSVLLSESDSEPLPTVLARARSASRHRSTSSTDSRLPTG